MKKIVRRVGESHALTASRSLLSSSRSDVDIRPGRGRGDDERTSADDDGAGALGTSAGR